jgi:hypothetical protein
LEEWREDKGGLGRFIAPKWARIQLRVSTLITTLGAGGLSGWEACIISKVLPVANPDTGWKPKTFAWLKI